MELSKLNYLKYKKLRLYWLLDFLKLNREFFINSDFCIVANIHCSSDEGIGTYLLHKDLWKYFEHTDDHKQYYPTMKDCYDFIDETEDIMLDNSDIKQLLRPNWQLIYDKSADDKVVGLMGMYEIGKVCRNDGSTMYDGDYYPVDYDFEKELKWRGELEKSRYYLDSNKPLFIKGIEVYKARYDHISVKIDNELINMFK